jgi:hypothetical protein
MKNKSKINLSKYENDWKVFNKKNKTLRIEAITLQQYVDYLHGKPLPTKSTKSTLSIPSYSIPERDPKQYKSVKSTGYIAVRNSKTDLHYLEKESPEVRKAILEKSKRLAPAYSKGAYQYVSDDAEITTLGRKI